MSKKSTLTTRKSLVVLLTLIALSVALFAGVRTMQYFSGVGLASSLSLISNSSSVQNSATAAPVTAVAFDDSVVASVRTSKSNYLPGETAKITGEGFGPNEVVTVQVLHNDGAPNTGSGHQPWYVNSDADGNFHTTWYVDPDDSADSSFDLTAVSLTASASNTFKDAGNPSADLDQCRNGKSTAPADCTGDGSGNDGWANGSVGKQTGHYIEGYSIPYRMRMSNLTAGNWTLDIGYDTVHSSRHAIDFLTHYDLIGRTGAVPTVPLHSLVFGHNAECIDPSDWWISVATNKDTCSGPAATSFFDIPRPIIPDSNPIDGGFPCPNNQYTGGDVLAGATSCPGTTFDAIKGAGFASGGNSYMSMWNGTITNIQYVQGQQNVVSGQGQQHTMMRVYFTVSAANASADGGNVDLAWGGHIGRSTDWGTGNSAGGISGDPYHMNLHGLCAGSTPNNGTLCTDGGAQDRALSADAVFQTGTVIIKKQMQTGSQDGTFDYTGTGTGIDANFSLTTDGGTAEIKFEGVPVGSKTVEEALPGSPFLFVSLSCTDPDNGTTISGRKATIDVDANETITCTYTNKEDFNQTRGRIIVVKDVVGVVDTTTDFTFNPSNFPAGGPFSSSFTLKDGGSKDSCADPALNCLPAGNTYAVSETANAEYSTTADCDDGSPVTAIDLAEGETVTCTFHNTPKSPSLSIDKTADAASVSAGDTIGFTITVSNASGATVGTAKGVTLSDALPGGSGIDWSIAGQSGGASCVINGSPQSETLACGPIDLAPGASFSVHVTSGTTEASCKAYPNTATAQATNHAQVTDDATETVQCPDIYINKTAGNATISAGDTASFTITVGNNGPGVAKHVTLNDPLPAGVTWVEDPDNPDCSINLVAGVQVLSCNFGDLASGASRSVTVKGVTDPADCGTLHNLATADADNDAPVNDDADIAVQCPDIYVNKTAGNATISAGDTASFTITVGNNGPGTAKNVTLNDPLPAGVTWAEDPDNPNCSIGLVAGVQVLSCSFGDLASGATRTVTVKGATDAADCGTLHNVATADADNDDPVNDDADIVVQCPDIYVNKSAGNGTISAGDTASFTITVGNNGPGVAKHVTLNDPLPSGVTWAEDPDNPDCSINLVAGVQVLSCNFGDMASGATKSVTVKGATDAADCGTLHNVATADADNDDPVNDDADIVVQCPDIYINKSSNGTINAGQVASFTIVVGNNGPGTAKNVTLSDPLPAGVTWAEDPDNPNCSIGLVAGVQVLSCSFGDLASGASRSVTVKGVTDPADCGTLHNLASADADNDDPVNDDADVIVQCPNLHISKVADADSVNIGDQIGFTITLTNTGAGYATGVVLTDNLPGNSGLDWSIASQDGLACSISGAIGSEVVTCNFATFAAGASYSVHVVSGTTAGSCATINNTAQYTSTIGGSGNASDSVDVLCGTIIIKKITKPADPNTSFMFDATGTGYVDFNLKDGGSNTQVVIPGNYSVTEAVPLGWVLTGLGGSTDPNTPYNCVITGSGGSTGVGDLDTQTATIELKAGDIVTCTFENTGQGVTRTQGFWATHPNLAIIAWNGNVGGPPVFGHIFPGVANVAGIGDQALCGNAVNFPDLVTQNSSDVMGGFWSDISKTYSPVKKRSALDQARMQLLQQLLAAELNASAFGSVPSSGSFAAWESAYCGTNQNAIKNAQQQAASFNTNGDSGQFTPGTSANSKLARFLANYDRWDILP